MTRNTKKRRKISVRAIEVRAQAIADRLKKPTLEVAEMLIKKLEGRGVEICYDKPIIQMRFGGGELAVVEPFQRQK